ncbi:MAG: type I restriction endonuclease subunit R [Desulfobulbaceae bacterium]
MTCEQHARQKIDALLAAAGWVIQDRENFNRNAALGVAVREFQLPNGACDYLLFIDGRATGVIEAKKVGVTLSGVADQSTKYMTVLPPHLARWSDQLLFDYESTGEETYFRDMRDPTPRSRRVFAFHKPETLLALLKQGSTLRHRLRQMPALDAKGLRDCQVEAITGLEKSLSKDKPRALIQMATGAGKTFTACTASYRLIKYAKAQRILFLVDRNNLGDQTLKEFQNYDPPGAGHRFTDTYIVQHLHGSHIDKDAKVVITTIQRLYSILLGRELAAEDEESSAFETWEGEEGEVRPVVYSPDIPIETFDLIIVDECHRSIYGLWRQVLEYFDAHIIGLTATPTMHTLAFFQQNLVSEYPYERSVADGVNVGYEVYRIRTEKSEKGGVVDAHYVVPVRDRRTRKLRYKQLDADRPYSRDDLDRTVTVPNQIRTVLECFRTRLFTELFPGRSGKWVPKTLIFAKDDNHAEEIVHIVRQVFDEGNDFAKKITYRNTGDNPKALIKGFRVDPLPRIAVTVDMIATGTDIKPVEILIFMRDVKSEGYFEQMKGRGVRSIADTDLKQVTPDADTKTRFVLVDAVGVTESQKTVSQPLERKRTVSFEQLLTQIAQGRRDDDAVSSLAGRLAALELKVEPEDDQLVREATGGKGLRDLANGLLDAIDSDRIEEAVASAHGAAPTEEQVGKVQAQLKDQACAPFDDPKTRQLLIDLKRKSEIVIDDLSTDSLLSAGYDLKEAKKRITSFKEFIEANRDGLLALQILYSRPQARRRLTYAAIQELARKLTDPPYHLTTADVWQAYKRLEASRVRGAPSDKVLTDIISLVRYATGQAEFLEPFSVQVEQRFNLWLGRQKKAGRDISVEQLDWLRLIKEHLAANAEIAPRDLMEFPAFTDKGGLVTARILFREQLNPLLDDLCEALVA